MRTRMKGYLLSITFFVALPFSAQSQGTVNFANIGGGVVAPVSGPDGLLGAGYIAQLQLVDGTNIGDPANFLANGLFSGGSRTVPGVAGGTAATLQVFVSNVSRDIAGTSGPVTVTLANPNALPEPEAPAPLLGLVAFEISRFPVAPDPTPFPPSSVNSEEVEIPDPILERDIRLALGKSVGALTLQDMAELTELQVGIYAPDTNWGEGPGGIVDSLKGLESAINLRKLDLAGLCEPWSLCYPTLGTQDLSPLKSLKNLEELNLKGNPLSDLSFLTGLQNLKDLDISVCSLTSFHFPNELNHLTRLNLNNNRINEIDLSGAPSSLSHLDLRGNQLRDREFLSTLKNPKILLLCRNPSLTDLEFLGKLQSVVELEIDGRTTSFEFLSSMSNLTRLTVCSLRLTSFRLPNGLNNLKELKLRGTVTSLDLSNIPQSLSKLDLSGNNLTSLSIQTPNNIEDLNLSGNRFRDTAFLNQLPNLKALNLSVNNLVEFKLPTEANDLRQLALSRNNLRGLDFFERLPRLESLELVACGLSEVKIPEHLSKLSTLDLSENNLRSLELPSASNQLEFLRLKSNRLQSLDIPENYLQLQELDVSWNKLRSLALPKDLRSLKYLMLRNNLIQSFVLSPKLVHLERLNLSENQLTNLKVSESLRDIEVLEIGDNGSLLEIELPFHMPNLRLLRLNNNNISSLTLPRIAPELVTLFLSSNRIRNLSFSEEFNSNLTIWVTDNPIERVEFPCCEVPQYLEIFGFPKSQIGFYNRVYIAPINNQLEVSWIGAELESKPQLAGEWERIEGAAKPYLVSPRKSQEFFRVRP